MIKFIFRILINTLSVYIAAKVVPGITVADITTALVFAIVFGILNALVKPLLVILTLPVNILTLGLFTIVINAFMIILAAAFVPGFQIASFFSAILFSFALAIVGWFLGLLAL